LRVNWHTDAIGNRLILYFVRVHVLVMFFVHWIIFQYSPLFLSRSDFVVRKIQILFLLLLSKHTFFLFYTKVVNHNVGMSIFWLLQLMYSKTDRISYY
jgi:hypothetical protein